MACCLLALMWANGGVAQEQKLGPHDRISVLVWGEEQLSREVEVRQDGKIALPLIGEVAAQDKSVGELQAALEEKLREYLQEPRVEVTLLAYAPLEVYILGQVSRPGSYSVPRGSGVMEAMALAGGALPTADKEAHVLRAYRELIPVNLADLMAARTAASPSLQAGDVLIVPFRRQADQVAVMGEVAKPGLYEFTAGMSLLDALSLAGLPTAGGNEATRPDLARVTLNRAGVLQTIDVARMLDEGRLEGNVQLQPGDVITVPGSRRVKVYAFGAFRSPGVRFIDEGQGLMEVILASGGPTEKAALSKASLVRLVDGEPQTIALNLESLIKEGDRTQDIGLQNGDVLYLPGGDKKGLGLESLLPLVPYLLF